MVTENMRTGKISETILKRSVLQKCREERPDVIQGAGIGRDCQIVCAEGKNAVSCSVHPAVINHIWNVRYSLEHAVNNLACSGCLPVSVMLTLLLPAETEETALKEIMGEASAVCRGLGVQIAGGHTEVQPSVLRPVLHVTALGFLEGMPLQPDRICPGMDVLVAGEIAREGTSILARLEENRLRTCFSADFIEAAKELGKSVSVLPAAVCARESGAVALHDASQGGIFGALWEMCEGAKVGLEADLRKIPIRQESVEICEYLGKNPYCLLSGGSLIAVASDGESMERSLRARGICASVIGKVTSRNDRILQNGEEKRYLERPAQDELYRADAGGQTEGRRGEI